MFCSGRAAFFPPLALPRATTTFHGAPAGPGGAATIGDGSRRRSHSRIRSPFFIVQVWFERRSDHEQFPDHSPFPTTGSVALLVSPGGGAGICGTGFASGAGPGP